MSDSALGKWLQTKFIPELDRLSGKVIRSPVEQHGDFSVLIINKTGIKTGIDSYAREALGAGKAGEKVLVQKDNKDLYLSKNTINKLRRNYFKALDAIEDRKINKHNLTEWDLYALKYSPEIIASVAASKQNVKIVLSNKYDQIRKDKVKYLTNPMLEEYKKILSKQNHNKVTSLTIGKNMAEIKAAKAGWDVGHGEFGESVSDIKAAKLKKMSYDKWDKGSSERETLKRVWVAFEEKSETKINHVMIIDDNGNLREDYQIVMSMQDAKGNAKDASDKEGPAVKAMRDEALSLLESEGSYTTTQAIHRTVLSALTKKSVKLPNVRLFGTAPKARIKSTGRATRKGNHKSKKQIPVVNMKNPIAGTRKLRVKAASKGQVGSPMQARNMLNATLSDAIRENMGGAALHNVSGRFADSVHVHNIKPYKGKSGIVQYTYMYNPYKTFEGEDERDPRLLIDKTIREQAAEMALGRFATQRL
jgi:hypothetical protein